MCGMIGYWGYKNAVDILVNGLYRLEYVGMIHLELLLWIGGRCMYGIPLDE